MIPAQRLKVISIACLFFSFYGFSGVHALNMGAPATHLSMVSSRFNIHTFSAKSASLSRPWGKKRSLSPFLSRRLNDHCDTIDGITTNESTATSPTILWQSWSDPESLMVSAASKSNLFCTVPNIGSNLTRSSGRSKKKVGSALELSLSPRVNPTSDLFPGGSNLNQRRKLKSLMALASIFEDACIKEETTGEDGYPSAFESKQESEIERRRRELINTYSASSDDGEKAFSMLLELDMVDVHLDPVGDPKEIEHGSKVIPSDDDEGNGHDDDKLEFENYEESDPGVDKKEDEKEDGEERVVVIEEKHTGSYLNEEDSALESIETEQFSGFERRKRDLIQAYSDSDDHGERAFAILLKLGMVEIHLDPDDPLYDHDWDFLYAPENNWIA